MEHCRSERKPRSSPPNRHVAQAREHGYRETEANLGKCSE